MGLAEVRPLFFLPLSPGELWRFVRIDEGPPGALLEDRFHKLPIITKLNIGFEVVTHLGFLHTMCCTYNILDSDGCGNTHLIQKSAPKHYFLITESIYLDVHSSADLDWFGLIESIFMRKNEKKFIEESEERVELR